VYWFDEESNTTFDKPTPAVFTSGGAIQDVRLHTFSGAVDALNCGSIESVEDKHLELELLIADLVQEAGSKKGRNDVNLAAGPQLYKPKELQANLRDAGWEQRNFCMSSTKTLPNSTTLRLRRYLHLHIRSSVRLNVQSAQNHRITSTAGGS
jgi:hypothetical protein